jgi:hypothetical protein
VQAALAYAINMKKYGLGPYVDGSSLLFFIAHNFELFSGPIWRHEDARDSLGEYLRLGVALRVLNHLVTGRVIYTKEDVELLLSALKEQETPGRGEAKRKLREFSLAIPSEHSGGGAYEFQNSEILKMSNEIRSAMIQAVYDDYFSQHDEYKDIFGYTLFFENKFENAKDAKAMDQALDAGFDVVLSNVRLETSRLVTILEDLALLDPRPAGDREPLV